MSHVQDQHREIYKLAVGMYAAAPGRLYFDALNAALESGMTVADVYRALAESPSFQLQSLAFRPQSNNTQFTDAFLDRVLGTEVSLGARQIAFLFVFDRLQGGVSRGDVMKIALDALDAISASDPIFGLAAQRFDNRIEVARHFTETINGSSENIGVLQTAIASVTSNPDTRDAAMDRFPGTSFLLTTGIDRAPAFSGEDGPDFFSAPVVSDGVLPRQTLNTADALDGAGGNDMLDAVILNENARPTLARIENIQVRFTGAGQLSLANATGLQQIVVSGSSSDGTVSSVGAVNRLIVKDQDKSVVFEGPTAHTLSLTLHEFSEPTTLAAITLQSLRPASLGGLVLSLNDAHAEVRGANLTFPDSVVINAFGTNTVLLGAGADSVKAIAITGPGSVDLSRAPLESLATLDATAATGAVAITVDDSAIDVITGSGDDTVTYTAPITGAAQIALGAGADHLVIGATTGKGALINGGPGSDALGAANGTWIDTAASAIYTGFETLEVGSGQGTYVMSRLPGVTNIALTNVAPKADISVVDAPSGTTLTLTSPSAGLLLFTTKLSVALADATGSTDALGVVLNAVDGNNNGVADGKVSARLTAPGIEILDITSSVLQRDSSVGAERYSNLLDFVVADRLRTVTLTGDAKLSLSFDSSTTTVTTIDASSASGGITATAVSQLQSVTFLGSSGVDSYDATKHGDSIDAGGGGDTIRLAQAGAIDRLIYAPGDSLLALSLVAQFDTVFNFGGTTDAAGNPVIADLIDLTSFGFTGAERAELVDKGLLDISAVNGTVFFQPDWFVSDGEAHAVAVGTRPLPLDPRAPPNSTIPAITYVFVDVNRSGDFEAAADLFVALSGVQDVSLDNFVF